MINKVEKMNEQIFQDSERREKLKLRMEIVISEMFDEQLKNEIQPYQEEIFNYLNKNGNFDLVDDKLKLEYFIRTYYKILSKKDVTLKEYISLQSLSRTSKNAVTEEIQKLYEEYKNILISAVMEKCVEQGVRSLDNDTINKVAAELFELHKIRQLYNNITTPIYKELGIAYSEEKHGPLTNAIESLLYLQLNTNLDIIHYLQSNTNLDLTHYVKNKKLNRKMKENLLKYSF